MSVWSEYHGLLNASVMCAGELHFTEAEFSGGVPVFPYAILTDVGPSTRSEPTLKEAGGFMRIRVDVYDTDKATAADKAEEFATAIRGVRGPATEYAFDWANDVTLRNSGLATPGHYRWVIEAQVRFRRLS